MKKNYLWGEKSKIHKYSFHMILILVRSVLPKIQLLKLILWVFMTFSRTPRICRKKTVSGAWNSRSAQEETYQKVSSAYIKYWILLEICNDFSANLPRRWFWKIRKKSWNQLQQLESRYKNRVFLCTFFPSMKVLLKSEHRVVLL